MVLDYNTLAFDKEKELKMSPEYSPLGYRKEPNLFSTPVSPNSGNEMLLSRECTDCFGPEEVKTLLNVLEL